MSDPFVLIRADASRRLGSGHVMRCLALAHELRGTGARVEFASRELEGDLSDLVGREHGFRVHRLDADASAQDADATIAAVAGRRPDWLVLDHYGLAIEWERRLRPHVGRILVLDDLANRRHDCDVLLDPNPAAEPARYRDLVPPDARLLLGPRYALLQRAFHEARLAMPTRAGPIERVLVAFGGVDAPDLTSRTLRALARAHLRNLEVDVVVGAGNPHRAHVEALVEARPRTRLHVQTDRMPELMTRAQLAVGAVGSSAWERCCLGLPTIAISLAPNQEPTAAALARAGAHLYLGRAEDVGEETLASALALAGTRHLFDHLATRARALVDGLGCRRTVRAMVADGAVELREATAEDCGTVLAWRDHPAVRRHARDARPIDPEDHRRWFEAVLHDPNRDLLVASLAGAPLGVLRFDVDATARTAEVSIYLAPDRIGQGLGPALLDAGERWLRRRRPCVVHVEGVVKGDNGPSQALFRTCGYAIDRFVFRKPLHRRGEGRTA